MVTDSPITACKSSGGRTKIGLLPCIDDAGALEGASAKGYINKPVL